MKDLKSSDSIVYLSGWKDIAKRLGRGVRTVQRYERDLGLPIRRPAGKTRSSVIATTAELDAWVYAKPLQESFGMRRELPNDNAALVDLKKALAEHHRLREEMSVLLTAQNPQDEITKSAGLARRAPCHAKGR